MSHCDAVDQRTDLKYELLDASFSLRKLSNPKEEYTS